MKISEEELEEQAHEMYIPDKIYGTAKVRTYVASPDPFYYPGETREEWLESHRRLLKGNDKSS